MKVLNVVIHERPTEFRRERYLVEVYQFPIDEIPDIIEIDHINETEIKVYHVEEENKEETRRDRLFPCDTKEVDSGMIDWNTVKKATSAMTGPINILTNVLHRAYFGGEGAGSQENGPENNYSRQPALSPRTLALILHGEGAAVEE